MSPILLFIIFSQVSGLSVSENAGAATTERVTHHAELAQDSPPASDFGSRSLGMQDVESVTSDSDTNKGDGSATGNSTVIRAVNDGATAGAEIMAQLNQTHILLHNLRSSPGDMNGAAGGATVGEGSGGATGRSSGGGLCFNPMLPGIDQLSEVSELRQHQHPLTLGLGNMATVLPEEVIARIPAIVEWVLQDL